ncbi:hypothetical protein [Paracraurococcus lichenis]|uniref:Replication initiation protein n=1 Tax=Paracraurococcus lichenis TaxID=3064888 RepID=A0ABT9ED36_9PROT|nr:hypothetical protein [Paracraurococcus sp. LOR1-02]MDO9713888.1 hypothetical protein [Paracraurococcus sp. LOR1-02]
MNSEAFAASIGKPLTVHATLHNAQSSSFSEESWSTFQNRIFDKMSRWLSRREILPAFVWTRECGPQKGAHTHLMLHLPCQHWAAFKDFVLSTGEFSQANIGQPGEAIRLNGGVFGMMSPNRRAGALKYLLKSLDNPRHRDALGIRHEPSEPVFCLRAGVSRSLSHQARAAAGWVELTTLAELRAHLHPAEGAKANG